MSDKNNMNYWFPKLYKSGINVPKTIILETDCDLIEFLDGKVPDGWFDFLGQINAATREVGYPAFMRTGHYSGKHNWTETCFIANKNTNIWHHIVSLIEGSQIVDFLGLPVQTWVVREFLNLAHKFTAFDHMPVAKERRYFFKDGEVVCHHPYWPKDAIYKPSVDNWEFWLDKLSDDGPGTVEDLTELTQRVAQNFDGWWSLDWACDTNGVWWAIDMAQGQDSWHWLTCNNVEISI